MVFIQSLILFGLATSFYFGQLWRIDLYNISFPAIDIFIVALAFFNIFKIKKINNQPLFWFIIYSWISLLLIHFVYKFPLNLSIPYLLRLTCLILLIIHPLKVPTWIYKYFILVIFANILFGLFQYFYWPDLTYFKSIGWDDHLNRLVSTYFDPTYTGLIYLLFLILIFFTKIKSNRFTYYGLILTSLIAIFLTYSRSTFLSLFVCSLYVSLNQKNIKLSIFSLLIIILAIFILPRPPGEGTHLERTSSINAKYSNVLDGIKIVKKYPVFGVGYNNLLSIKNDYQSHSRSGFDSSLLTILTTTGIVGLSLFSVGFYKLFNSYSITKKTMLIAIFTHSLFANSLLYPFTLVFLLFV